MGQYISSDKPRPPTSSDPNYEQYKADPVIPDPKVYALLQTHLARGSFFADFFMDLKQVLCGNMPGGGRGTELYINDIKYKVYLKLLAFDPVIVDGTIHLNLVNDYPYFLFMACLLNIGYLLNIPKYKNVTIVIHPPSPDLENTALIQAAPNLLGYIREIFDPKRIIFMRMAYFTPLFYPGGGVATTLKTRMSEYVWDTQEHRIQKHINNWENYHLSYTYSEDNAGDNFQLLSLSASYDANSDIPQPLFLAQDSMAGSHVSSNQQGPRSKDNPDTNNNNVKTKKEFKPVLLDETNPKVDGFFQVSTDDDEGVLYVPATFVHFGMYTTPTPGRYMALSVFAPLVERTFLVIEGKTVVPVLGVDFRRQVQNGQQYDGKLIILRRYVDTPEMERTKFELKIAGMGIAAFRRKYGF